MTRRGSDSIRCSGRFHARHAHLDRGSHCATRTARGQRFGSRELNAGRRSWTDAGKGGSARVSSRAVASGVRWRCGKPRTLGELYERKNRARHGVAGLKQGGGMRSDPPSASAGGASRRRDRRRDWRVADLPRRPVLFVNPRSGNGTAARVGVAERARELGIEVITLGSGSRLVELVRVAVENGADALGMAGGDGSLSVVAAAAAANGLPFVCIPAGTRNHFAGDLGLNRRDPVAALRAFGDGLEGRIDLGEVNGRPFLNNVSLGVYGEAVRTSAYREAKVRTLVETAERVLGPSGQAPGLRLVDDEGREHDHALIVIVSNNPYALDRLPARGARPALDGGRLGIVVLDAPSRGPHQPGRAWTAPALEVSASAAVHAGIDGEAVELDPPLRFAIRPAALRVRVPRGHGSG